MQLSCNEFEVLLCDYVDNTLSNEARTRINDHAASCQACAELMRDVAGFTQFIERVPAVQIPQQLVTKILFEKPPAESRRGAWNRLKALLQPILQPKFAMGMAMTILSFSMLGKFTGIQVRQLKPSDLDPVKVYQLVDDSAHRGWERAMKYYDNLRLVYEIQTRLKEWNDQDEEERKVQGKEDPSVVPIHKSSLVPDSKK